VLESRGIVACHARAVKADPMSAFDAGRNDVRQARVKGQAQPEHLRQSALSRLHYFTRKADARGAPSVLVPLHGLGHRLPDFGAAIRAFKDEINP
jgi:hypothetical protein